MNAVFYRRERFELLSTGGYWLSETPHIPGTRSWRSDCTRLANWARLVEHPGGREFRVMNTHLDHISQPARENGARLICEDALAYPAGYPQILTGDMNCDAANPAIDIFLNAGWKDSYASVHETPDPGFTYHGFQGPAYRSDIGKMDWIFFRGGIRVLSAEIVRDSRNGRYPSDHYFVMAGLD